MNSVRAPRRAQISRALAGPLVAIQIRLFARPEPADSPRSSTRRESAELDRRDAREDIAPLRALADRVAELAQLAIGRLDAVAPHGTVDDRERTEFGGSLRLPVLARLQEPLHFLGLVLEEGREIRRRRGRERQDATRKMESGVLFEHRSNDITKQRQSGLRVDVEVLLREVDEVVLGGVAQRVDRLELQNTCSCLRNRTAPSLSALRRQSSNPIVCFSRGFRMAPPRWRIAALSSISKA